MSGELIRRPGGIARRGGTDLALAHGAQSTARVSFGSEIVTWKQMPAATRRAARRSSPVVAESVQRDHRTRVENARPYEYATAWRVYEDAVVLAQVARPLAPAPEGGMRPAGGWEPRSVDVHEAAAPPRRRRGVVDVADELGMPGAAGTGALAIVPTGQGPAAEAWSYLPKAVRAAAERLIPDPDTWLGQLSQVTSTDGFPQRQDVVSLRLSADRAVAIVATRSLVPIPGAGTEYHVAQMARVPWVVEQIGFDLGRPQARLTQG